MRVYHVPQLNIHICILDTGAQPLVSDDGLQVLAVNGEIYNHIPLRKSVGPDVKFKTHSDCEVILPLVRYSYLRYSYTSLIM